MPVLSFCPKGPVVSMLAVCGIAYLMFVCTLRLVRSPYKLIML